MSWVKLDDGAYEHTKLLAAGARAAWLWVCCLSYCNGQKRRDGFVPRARVATLYPGVGMKEAERLVAVRLLEECDGGFLMHGYHEYQPSASLSDVRSMVGKQGGIKSGEARRSKREAIASTKENVLLEPTNEPPSRPDPDPSPPDPESSLTGAREDRFLRTFATALPELIPISDLHRELCRKRNLDVENEMAKYRIWAKENGRMCLDWPADFERWIRNARVVPEPKRGPASTGETRAERQTREQLERIAMLEAQEREAAQ